MGFLKGLHVLGEAGYVEFDVPLRAFAGQSVCVRAQLCCMEPISQTNCVFSFSNLSLFDVFYTQFAVDCSVVLHTVLVSCAMDFALCGGTLKEEV